MTPLRQHRIAALQRRGKSERTQQSSVREVRLLAQCYGTSPDLISEQQLQHSVLHRLGRTSWKTHCNVRALSPISRALFTQEMRTAGQLEPSDPHVWNTPWNVHRQANSHGATSCKYLAPSVCKVALSNRRIVGRQDRIVTCTDRKPGRTRPRTTRLHAFECMRPFLQHVLPAGFMQVRHVGFMHAHCRITTDTLRQMLTLQTGATLELPRSTATTPAQGTCPNGGAPLSVLSRVWPLHMTRFDPREDHGMDTSLPVSMLLWQAPGDGTAAP